MLRIFMAMMLVSMTLVLSACETTEGVGQDIENTGENIGEGVEEMGDEAEDEY
ncbi:MAG: hypothetical protein AB1650_00270 [Candidatus Omnitrophota bacterium]